MSIFKKLYNKIKRHRYKIYLFPDVCLLLEKHETVCSPEENRDLRKLLNPSSRG
jgi:hypothetical protein